MYTYTGERRVKTLIAFQRYLSNLTRANESLRKARSVRSNVFCSNPFYSAIHSLYNSACYELLIKKKSKRTQSGFHLVNHGITRVCNACGI